MLIRIVLCAVLAMVLCTPVMAETTPQVTVTPAPEAKADMAKVNKALAAAASLNTAEKKKLLSAIQRQLPKKSAAEKASDRQMTIARWQAMPTAEKTERREKAAAKWATLNEVEKKYQREHIVERLRAMTESDRAAVLAQVQTPPKTITQNGAQP